MDAPSRDDSPNATGASAVLLLVHHRNRDLLASRLAADYETLTSDGASLPEAFDACILDVPSFSHYHDELIARKADAEPLFLPYLLVVREHERGAIPETVWAVVDDRVTIPTTGPELEAHLRTLLRTRQQSIELRDHKEHELRELERQNERLDRFASMVSHDLRNPLGVADGYLRLARGECDSEFLAPIGEAHDRMERLIDDLLALAREGATVGDVGEIDLGQVVRRAWKHIESTGTLELPEEVIIVADANRLQALFENLFRNAVEHGSTDRRDAPDDAVEHGSTGNQPPADDAVEHGSTGNRTSSDDAHDHAGPHPTVRVGPLEGGFFVEDDGPGIPEADRERIFEYGVTSDEDGTGLGLAIVSEIAQAHEWTVTVTEGRDGGARFEFSGVDRVT